MSTKTRCPSPILISFAACLTFALVGRGLAQSSYPMVMSISPVAATVGETSEHEIESRYSMFGAYRVIVTGEGVVGEIVTPMEKGKDGKEPNLTSIKVKFTVAADALPGVRDMRIVGPWGASTLGQLVVSRGPLVAESGDNNTVEKAQQINVPATICGAIERAEDVDYFKFALDEPTDLVFHCRAMQLEDKIHDLQQHVDPIITLKSAGGTTLAAADNDYAADPLLSFRCEKPGDYLLEVRDVRYQGNRYWNYSIEISSRPFVANVHPVAIEPGKPTSLELVGAQLADAATAQFDLPEGTLPGIRDVQVPVAGGLSNEVAIVVADGPVVLESEEANDTAEQAQPIPAGKGCLSGRIETNADVDLYRFEAKKGDRFDVDVVARRLWSELDPIIAILDASGRRVTESDDRRIWNKLTSQDPLIENWAAPADGAYFIEIRDVHLRGGPGFVYSLKLTHAQPHFELTLDSDKTWLAPGTCGAIFVRAVRHNGFGGEIALQIDGLPKEVTASCGRILAGESDGCIVLEAAPDANLVAGNITVRGTATHRIDDEHQLELAAVAQPMQEIYMPGGGRNHWPVELHTVAVGAPADLRAVKLSTYDVQLKPGESKKIEVDIERAPGFDKNVTLDMLFTHLSSVYADTLPKGVKIDGKSSKTLLTGTAAQGAIVFTAAADAPPAESQQCCVMANVSINFVMKATYSSKPVNITVLPQ